MRAVDSNGNTQVLQLGPRGWLALGIPLIMPSIGLAIAAFVTWRALETRVLLVEEHERQHAVTHATFEQEFRDINTTLEAHQELDTHPVARDRWRVDVEEMAELKGRISALEAELRRKH